MSSGPINPDCLVERLNELATNAVEPSYNMTRTESYGDNLSVSEFNTLSTNVAWLAANRYVANADDPDATVAYPAITATVTADITTPRLRAIEATMRKLRWLRAAVTWDEISQTKVTVTHATWSEPNCKAAYGLVLAYWGRDATETIDGFSVVATTTVTATVPTSFVKFEWVTSAGVEVVGTLVRFRPTFDFADYDAAKARFAIRAKPCDPETTPVPFDRPTTLFVDVIGGGNDVWTVLDKTFTELMTYRAPVLAPVDAAPSRPGGYPTAEGGRYTRGWIVADAAVLIFFTPAVGDCSS